MLGELKPKGPKGPGVRVSMGTFCIPSHAPLEDQPFSHSLRAIYTVLLDPRDPSLQSERTQGFAAGLVYGRAKCLPMLGAFIT